jgi:hypothetical protein
MLFVSQPGTLEPTAMLISTFEWSANADGVTAISERIASKPNNEYTIFCICLIFQALYLIELVIIKKTPLEAIQILN